MLRGVKIRIIPTPEQEVLFKKSCGVARWAYNFCISEKERIRHEYNEDISRKKRITGKEIRRYINNVLKPTEKYKWLKEVSSNVMKQAVKEAEFAYDMYFKKLCNKPKFKKKGISKDSFYVNYESLVRTQKGFKGEKLGEVKTSKPLPKLKDGEIYYRPRISFDGKFWNLSVVIDKKPLENIVLTNESLGIDLGIKELATCSNGMIFHNPNSFTKIKKLEKRLLRAEHRRSKRLLNVLDHYEKTPKGRKAVYKKELLHRPNLNKIQNEIRLIHNKISNIRLNYIHQTTRSIVKTKPCRIVMENITISGLLKNKHVSKSIKNSSWYEFRKQVEYKCEEYGIEFVIANTWFPSSKTCSNCGTIKKKLPLQIRTYHCKNCGLSIDRDYNASINLANYNK